MHYYIYTNLYISSEDISHGLQLKFRKLLTCSKYI